MMNVKSRGPLLVVVILCLLGMAQSADPCRRKRCPRGQFCVSVSPPCPVAPCGRVARCVRRAPPVACPRLSCDPCPPGLLRMYDHVGCETCQCHDPCLGLRCPKYSYRSEECAVRVDDGCIHAVCIPRPQCHAWTDPHYRSFDGALIDYQGVGLYVMAQRSSLARCRCLPDFQVLVLHERRGRRVGAVSYLNSVTLVLPGKASVMIAKHGIVFVNGLPYPGSSLPPGIKSIDLFSWWGMIRVETDFGLVMRFDGRRWAIVEIPSIYTDCVEGLCGNADGNMWNDFITRYGRNAYKLPRKQRNWAIGNPWRVASVVRRVATAGRSRSFDAEASAEDIAATGASLLRMEVAPLSGKEQQEDRVDLYCDTDMTNTVKYCGSLKDVRGPLAGCLKLVPNIAKELYAACQYDVCANKEDKEVARQLACVNLDMFVAVCGNGSLDPKWRALTGCLCPGDLVWSKGGKQCTAVCPTLTAPAYRCSYSRGAKCRCPLSAPFQHGLNCLTFTESRKLLHDCPPLPSPETTTVPEVTTTTTTRRWDDDFPVDRLPWDDRPVSGIDIPATGTHKPEPREPVEFRAAA